VPLDVSDSQLTDRVIPFEERRSLSRPRRPSTFCLQKKVESARKERASLVPPTAEKSRGKHYGFVKWIFGELGRSVKKCGEIRESGDVTYLLRPLCSPSKEDKLS